MKETMKVILELIGLGKAIYSAYQGEKNARKKRDIIKAIEECDLDTLRRLHLGRN